MITNSITARTTRRATTRTALAALAVGSLLAACGSDSKSADTTTAGAGSAATASADTTATAATTLAVTDAWARTSPAVATAGAVYLVVTNSGSVDDALVAAGVDATIAQTAELHETVTTGGDTGMTPDTGMTADTGMTPDTGMAGDTTADGGEMMQMQPVDRIVVPANGTVALAPGGYHIMLLDLVAPLAVGSTVDITLTFENAGVQVVTAAVRDVAP